MQETIHNGKTHIEAFEGADSSEVIKAMDERFKELQALGHELVERHTSQDRTMPDHIRKMKGNRGRKLRSAWTRAF